jgi:DNA-binding transcriptional regulator YdaS (Cro superfamily)
MSKSTWRKAVDEAVKALGSLKRVAERLGITPQAIHQWPEAGPPAKHVLALEEMSGVPRYEIRPDIYGPPPKRVRPSTRDVSRAA